MATKKKKNFLTEERRKQVWSFVKGALIAAAGAGLVSLSQALSVTDFSPEVLPWAQALASTLANLAKIVAKL